jgi:rod shape-determining protein MreB and related proteins
VTPFLQKRLPRHHPAISKAVIMSFKSKTAAFIGLDRLRDLVTNSLAIDMGAAATVIYEKGRGVVVDEPSLIAVNTITREIMGVGQEAQKMYGREARDVTVIAPMANGVVADFEGTNQMLEHFARKARSSFSHFTRRAFMSVLAGITPVERRALLSASQHARIGRVWMIEEGLAAAFGTGVDPSDRHASAIVNIGGGTTSVVVVANGAIVHASSERIGGSHINAAIINHVRRHRGLAIGIQTAERLKLQIASAIVPIDLSEETAVSGRDVLSGTPSAVDITAGEIYPVAQEVVRKIVDGIARTLTELAPEVAGDIYERGLVLIGGGSLFGGIDDFLRDSTKLPVRIADEPRYAIVRGLAQLFDKPQLLRRLKLSEPPTLLDVESQGSDE